MITEYTGWRRDKEGLGLWPHQGKVVIAGWGQSPVDRRWDGDLEHSLGAYAMMACQQALDDAGVKAEEVDGLIVCSETGAGATGGSSADWGPTREYFAPPYDTEWGLSRMNAKWLIDNFPGLTNVTFAPEQVPAIGEEMGMAAQAVAEGMCNVCLMVYPMNNFEGRYRHGGLNASPYAEGNRQWGAPWNTGDGLLLTGAATIQQYCAKYGGTKEELLGTVIINQHRNGLIENDWGYYALHGASNLTFDDYCNTRPVIWPMNLWDCDRPVNNCGAYLFTTGDRAKDMKQKPIYVLNHNAGMGGFVRSSTEVLAESQAGRSQAARMVYEGSGLRPQDIDIFNPYDGYSFFLPLNLEAFGWHGVKEGEAQAFFNDDISVEGPHPFCSGGGNLGSGRTRTAMYIDSIQQLRGTAGKRQVNIKAETAICAFAPARSCAYLTLSSVLP